MNGVKLGDLVFTYDWRLTQVMGLEYGDDRVTGVGITGVRLNTGEIVYPYELIKVKRLGTEAKRVLEERGRCAI
ncbi:MAG: hypothetical protein PWQ67_2517 [Clostridia bacterium]|nr:hypothetical protein [Clostridia bacterium]